MILNNRTYGIQAFDTPEGVFALLASDWGNIGMENMYILDDRKFC